MASLAPAEAVEHTAEGFRRVAHSRMAGAVRRLCGEDASDPAQHVLVAFGGAGPAHACGVARELGITEVHIPLLAGVWSAVGIGMARPRWERQAPVNGSIAAAIAEVRRGGSPVGPEQLSVTLRHVGTTGALELPLSLDRLTELEAEAAFPLSGAGPLLATGGLRRDFDGEHRRLHGFSRPELAVEVVSVRCVVEEVLPGSDRVEVEAPTGGADTVRCWFAGAWQQVPLVRVGSEPMPALHGPAVCILPGATLVVEPGWVARHAGDHIILVDQAPTAPRLGTERHPVHTAVFGARLAGMAEAMGVSLARLARSVSIRERRDYSCAVFDAAGRLAVNAPHVPVHLGAMGETVRSLLRLHGPALAAGQAWVTNDPYAGGSHLPDITVIRPVFDGRGGLAAFVACRGHHVDVGGASPGSMPPDAVSIDEEGVVIPLSVLVDEEGSLFLPSLPGCRQPDDVEADLLAQVAACAVGAGALRALMEQEGATVLRAQLGHLQAVASDAVAEVLADRTGESSASTELDDGTRLSVRLCFGGPGGGLRVELHAPPHPGNRNAPEAVARAAVLYVLRCMVGVPIPLNEGVLDRVSVVVNRGGLFDPCPPRAVAGGNVETSQLLVDTLFVALGLGAASQGTMNNLTVGTQRGAFYETIGGGAGATAEGPGASAIQVHMTNTRSTDVEVLERRFPVRLERLARRWGSGGGGRHAGGDGVIREWRFLDDATVALLAGRRRLAPPGLDGGHPGAVGLDQRDAGTGWEPCPSVWTAKAGDRLRIETPGGGGWGEPKDAAKSERDR